MIGSWQGSLDREFLIGFFLPATVLMLGVALVATHLAPQGAGAAWAWVGEHSILSTAVAGVAIWLVAASLFAFNGVIFRLKEGYVGRLVLHPLRERRRREFDRLPERIAEIETKIAERATSGSLGPLEELLEQNADLKLERAIHWPADRRLVLPLKFGNTVRAAETYPAVLYGADAPALWERLLAVVPESFRRRVDQAKAEVDFLLNLWTVWCLLLGLYLAAGASLWVSGLWHPGWLDPFVVGVAVASIASLSHLARAAVVPWGEMIRAAFDLYLPDLARRLGLDTPPDARTARAQWEGVSAALLYRDAQELEIHRRPPTRRGRDVTTDVERPTIGVGR